MDMLDAYVSYFERLSPETLNELDALVTPDVRFKDPFNDLRGVADMRKAMAMAFDHGPPRFEVIDRARSDHAAYLLWRYTLGSGFVIEGDERDPLRARRADIRAYRPLGFRHAALHARARARLADPAGCENRFRI